MRGLLVSAASDAREEYPVEETREAEDYGGDFPPPLHPRCIDSGKSFATKSKLSRNDDAEAGGWYIRDVQWLQEQHNSRCSKLNRNFDFFKFDECPVGINVGLSWQTSLKFHGVRYKG